MKEECWEVCGTEVNCGQYTGVCIIHLAYGWKVWCYACSCAGRPAAILYSSNAVPQH